MNCKPGDLAIVLRGMDRSNSENAGKIVTVIGPGGHHATYGPCWNVKLSSATLFWKTTPKGDARGMSGFRDEGACPDAWLRRIDRPSDDATDEMILRVGSPTWAKAYGVDA